MGAPAVEANACVSAKVLDALGPALRAAAEDAASDWAFMSQKQTQAWGCYLLRQEKGVLVVVTNHCLMLAVYDEGGHASENLKVHLPDGLLDAIEPRFCALHDENGAPYEVQMQPMAGRVLMHTGFAATTVDAADGWTGADAHGVCGYDGALGTWWNRDTEKVIDLDSYRLKPAKTGRLKTVLRKVAALAGPAAPAG